MGLGDLGFRASMKTREVRRVPKHTGLVVGGPHKKDNRQLKAMVGFTVERSHGHYHVSKQVVSILIACLHSKLARLLADELRFHFGDMVFLQGRGPQ